ncbi:MAG: putative addiction module antidote protein [Alphaproteobacteria bacterium]|nr:putative addiction module antidote protein [Alphaproteobacteria bacterium]
MPKLRDYDSYLINSLKDPTEASLYLSAAFEDDDPRVAAIALDHVLRARNHTVTRIAEKAHLNREHLYRILAGKVEPEFRTLKVLCAIAGFSLTVQDQQPIH